jgi:hypothetical protein
MRILDLLKIPVIEKWREAHRLWSVRLSAFSAALMTAWSSLPGDLKTQLPHLDCIAALLFVLVAVSRILAQEAGQ